MEVAEADLARKQESYKRERDEYSAKELDRAMALTNLARINLERTMNQEGSSYSLSYLQWQVEELRNQLLELHIKVESNSRR